MSAITLFDLNGEQRFTGTSVGGGGAQPSLLTLGPYTVGSADGYTAPVDLGANAIGVIRLYVITLTAISFDGGNPANGYAIDFDYSLNGTTWAGDGSAAPDKPTLYGAQPASFVSPSVPVILRGNCGVPRYVRMLHAFSGDQGPAASATFHVDLTYF